MTSPRLPSMHERDPWPIHQTDTTAASGNALQACVASILHLELAAVPNFIQDKAVGYEQAIRNFVPQHGYTCRKVLFNATSKDDEENNKNDEGKICILRGQSPRGTFGHVVVAKKKKCPEENGSSQLSFDILWDPHPDGTGLDATVPYGWYMVLDEQPPPQK